MFLFFRNPFGRTGIRGRGALQRFGPNHKAIIVITARVGNGFRFVVQRTVGKMLTLPQVNYDGMRVRQAFQKNRRVKNEREKRKTGKHVLLHFR